MQFIPALAEYEKKVNQFYLIKMKFNEYRMKKRVSIEKFMKVVTLMETIVFLRSSTALFVDITDDHFLGFGGSKILFHLLCGFVCMASVHLRSSFIYNEAKFDNEFIWHLLKFNHVVVRNKLRRFYLNTKSYNKFKKLSRTMLSLSKFQYYVTCSGAALIQCWTLLKGSESGFGLGTYFWVSFYIRSLQTAIGTILFFGTYNFVFSKYICYQMTFINDQFIILLQINKVKQEQKMMNLLKNHNNISAILSHCNSSLRLCYLILYTSIPIIDALMFISFISKCLDDMTSTISKPLLLEATFIWIIVNYSLSLPRAEVKMISAFYEFIFH